MRYTLVDGDPGPLTLLLLIPLPSSLTRTSPGQTSRNCLESKPSLQTLTRRSRWWRATEIPPGNPPSVPGEACRVVLMCTDERDRRAMALWPVTVTVTCSSMSMESNAHSATSVPSDVFVMTPVAFTTPLRLASLVLNTKLQTTLFEHWLWARADRTPFAASIVSV